jgi:hypothetical protein
LVWTETVFFVIKLCASTITSLIGGRADQAAVII